MFDEREVSCRGTSTIELIMNETHQRNIDYIAERSDVIRMDMNSCLGML